MELIVEGQVTLECSDRGPVTIDDAVRALRAVVSDAGYTVSTTSDHVTERDAVVTPTEEGSFLVFIGTDPTSRDAFDMWPRAARILRDRGWLLSGQVRAIPADGGFTDLEYAERWAFAGTMASHQVASVRWLDDGKNSR